MPLSAILKVAIDDRETAMRLYSARNALRCAALGAFAFALSACSGGTSSGSNTCYPGVASAIVSPRDSTNAPGTTQVVIALEARSDLLGSSWDLVLRDNFGNRVESSTLGLIDGSALYHPFTDTDYFYAANVSSLPSGRQWRVYLNNFNSSCSAQYLSTFSN
jgi:hypothetical protein